MEAIKWRRRYLIVTAGLVVVAAAGTFIPSDPFATSSNHPDELLLRITKYGVAKAAELENYDSAMPAYEKVLGDAEIVAVLSWIMAQWPAEIKTKHDKINASVTRTP